MKNKLTTIKTMALILFAVAGMALLAASSVHAGDQDFTLINKTGVEIHSLHVAPHSSDSWEEDPAKTRSRTEKVWKLRLASTTRLVTGTSRLKTKRATLSPGRI